MHSLAGTCSAEDKLHRNYNRREKECTQFGVLRAAEVSDFFSSVIQCLHSDRISYLAAGN